MCHLPSFLSERINQTVEITKHTVDIEEKGVKLKLTIVDTPGFGDAVNNNEWYELDKQLFPVFLFMSVLEFYMFSPVSVLVSSGFFSQPVCGLAPLNCCLLSVCVHEAL